MLVADDNRDTVDWKTLLLETLGQDVRSAYDGLSALRIAREFSPEIVFLDLDMPRMNGFEAAREMRKLPGMQNARLIAYTGFARDEYRGLVSTSSFDDFIVKPIPLPRIISILNHTG